MARNAAITIIFTIAIIFATAAITLSLATTTSVGGSAYRSNSETCASCHNEVPYVKGYEGSPHAEGNVTCMDCHQYKSPITDVQCLTCHEDYSRSNKTAFRWQYGIIIDAHSKYAHMPAKCTTCHLEHKFELGVPRAATESLCKNCHKPYNPPRQR
ncbi:MAG: cytochrome c3 family protein [Thaumarchaeota archaeon]|nr:cytochrome c3 family protein [Nitrososphaerota archaeon]